MQQTLFVFVKGSFYLVPGFFPPLGYLLVKEGPIYFLDAHSVVTCQVVVDHPVGAGGKGV